MSWFKLFFKTINMSYASQKNIPISLCTGTLIKNLTLIYIENYGEKPFVQQFWFSPHNTSIIIKQA